MKKFLEQKKSAIVSGMSNNKGFSLVELIIVVAIMGVLMGVLAPQYLRFVETSRVQADETAFNEVMKVMTIATASLTDMPLGITVTWGSDGVLVVSGGTSDEIAAFEKEISLTLGTAMNIGAPSSTRYSTHFTAHTLTVGVDSSGVPFVWSADAHWSYALGIPNASTGGSPVTTEPTPTVTPTP